MRYRRLSATGDYQFGQQQTDFFINQPEAVAQAVTTRLRLFKGEWFLDTTDGMDWRGSVLGNRTTNTRDPAIRARVLLTPGVTDILNYNSSFEPNTRNWRAAFSVNTLFGNYGVPSPGYISPLPTPQPQPPEPPINVTVTAIDDSSVQVGWTPYTP